MDTPLSKKTQKPLPTQRKAAFALISHTNTKIYCEIDESLRLRCDESNGDLPDFVLRFVLTEGISPVIL